MTGNDFCLVFQVLCSYVRAKLYPVRLCQVVLLADGWLRSGSSADSPILQVEEALLCAFEPSFAAPWIAMRGMSWVLRIVAPQKVSNVECRVGKTAREDTCRDAPPISIKRHYSVKPFKEFQTFFSHLLLFADHFGMDRLPRSLNLHLSSP